MSEKLKPCPFCGGEASLSVDTEAVRDTENKLWAYQITCNKCCATTGLCWSEELAIKAWKRRAHEQKQF